MLPVDWGELPNVSVVTAISAKTNLKLKSPVVLSPAYVPLKIAPSFCVSVFCGNSPKLIGEAGCEWAFQTF